MKELLILSAEEEGDYNDQYQRPLHILAVSDDMGLLKKFWEDLPIVTRGDGTHLRVWENIQLIEHYIEDVLFGGVMVYLIKREDGKYVSRPGSIRSYTNDRSQAAEYTTEDTARAEACDNESIWYGSREQLIRSSKE